MLAARHPQGEQLGAALVGLAAAPLWLTAVPEAAAGGALLALAVVLVGTARPVLPRALPGVVVVLALVEAARGALAGGIWPSALGATLVVTGLCVGGVAAGAEGRLGVVVGLSAALLGARTWQATRAAPTHMGEARVLARVGALDRHLPTLTADPMLGLSALQTTPDAHPLALALGFRFGDTLPLNGGWRPVGADLAPARRVAAARWLERHGRGGEGRRLLARGRWRDDTVAWTWELFRRVQGFEPQGFEPQGFETQGFEARGLNVDGSTATPPAGVARLPDRIALGWEFLQNGEQTLEFHADTELSALLLEARGEPFGGDPTLLISLNGPPSRAVPVPLGVQQILVAERVPPGPHRLDVRFHDDHVGEGGDRNVFVTGLSAMTRGSD